CFDRLEPDAGTELNPAAVRERRECVLGLAGGAEINRRAGAIAQLQMSRKKVCVKMRQDDMANRQTMFGRKRKVLIDIALRIDDGGCAALGVGNQIRRVRQTVEIELFEQ